MRRDAVLEVEKALAVLGERARRDVPLAALTTYGVGGRAAVFVRAETLHDLALASHALALSTDGPREQGRAYEVRRRPVNS